MREQEIIPGHEDRVRDLVERLADAAASWLATLSIDQRLKAVHGFPSNDERTRWYYTPTEQGGLPLVEMNPLQQRLAHRLVATGLSLPGYVTAAAIMGLENVLDALEGWRRNYDGRRVPHRGRDPLLYFVSVFGEPGARSWGWRLGGHHVSLHYAIVDGRLASPTPMFFGANPAESRLVGPGILRPLAGEEDLGRELVHSLDAHQLAAAIISPFAPGDIVQANRAFVEPGVVPQLSARASADTGSAEEGATSVDELRAGLSYQVVPKGLCAARMTSAQRQVLVALIHQYVDRLPEEVAEPQVARLTGPALDAMCFAWAGGRERRQSHYYRVQGPRLLVEYDNTQNDANHIHAVWRDPEGDFGVDLLAQHYREAH